MGSYSVAQLIAIRSLSALVVLVPFLLRDSLGQLWRLDRPGLQALRAGLLAVEGLGFYAAVAYLPLGDVVTYWLAAPIYVAALTPLVLDERVSGAVWAAIGLGFVGVVVAPNASQAGLTPAAGIALLGSAAFAGAMLLGLKLRGTPGLADCRGADRFGCHHCFDAGRLGCDAATRFGGALPAGRGGDGRPYSGEPVVQTCRCRSGDALSILAADLGHRVRRAVFRRYPAHGDAAGGGVDRTGRVDHCPPCRA